MHVAKVQNISGVILTGFTKERQVQINLPNNTYTVLDNVWHKQTAANNFDIVVNESKLSSLVLPLVPIKMLLNQTF